MKKVVMLSLLLGVCFSVSASLLAQNNNPGEDLCSPEGLMKLVPQLKNSKGKFEIPNPKKDLKKFLFVHDTLINIIDIILAQTNSAANPYTFSSMAHPVFHFSPNWKAAEVGFVTDAKTIPDFSKGGFAYYGGKSFLQGIIPVKGTDNSFYTVPGSVVYIHLMPTSLQCVNRIMETSGLNGGTMIASSYALGNKKGEAYLVVNGCQNTAQTITMNNKQVLAPGGSAFLGMQWAVNKE